MRYILVLVTAGALFAAELKLGKPLALRQATPIATLLASPDAYLGKVVQVKGKVTEVCQSMGCWMAIVDPETSKIIRVKVNDGDIVFPKDSPGKRAVAEGKFTKVEMSREQAAAWLKHEADEKGKSFDAASVKEGMTVYQLAGEGAVILD